MFRWALNWRYVWFYCTHTFFSLTENLSVFLMCGRSVSGLIGWRLLLYQNVMTPCFTFAFLTMNPQYFMTRKKWLSQRWLIAMEMLSFNEHPCNKYNSCFPCKVDLYPAGLCWTNIIFLWGITFLKCFCCFVFLHWFFALVVHWLVNSIYTPKNKISGPFLLSLFCFLFMFLVPIFSV